MRGTRTRTLRLGVAATSVLAALLVFGPVANATQPECRVENVSRQLAYNSNTSGNPLGTAIERARAGDTLQVIGTCHGNYVIEKNLTIQGRASAQHADTIDGDDAGIVLTIPAKPDGNGGFVQGATVRIRNLTITGGHSVWPASAGAAIANNGALTVVDAVLRGNSADDRGGGIGNDQWGVANIVNTTFTENFSFAGSGIFNLGLCTVVGSTITRNVSAGGGGGISNQGGQLTLVNTQVTFNSAHGGGGIESYDPAITALTDHTVVTGNEAGIGGGILWWPTLRPTVDGTSSVSGNSASLPEWADWYPY